MGDHSKNNNNKKFPKRFKGKNMDESYSKDNNKDCNPGQSRETTRDPHKITRKTRKQQEEKSRRTLIMGNLFLYLYYFWFFGCGFCPVIINFSFAP